MVSLIVALLSLIHHLYGFYAGWREAGPSLFLFGLFAANLIPIVIGYRLTRTRYRSLGIGWLLATLAASCWAVWAGMLRPGGSSSSLISLVAPFWNALVVGPVGAGLVALTLRLWPPKQPWS